MMIVGFTGTQHGLTKSQLFRLMKILSKLKEHGMTEFHHEDCVGADERAHAVVLSLEAEADIIIHPPDDSSKRAFCDGDHIWDEKPYLDRKQDIVDACSVLVACPQGREEELRSGTWATVRMARKAGRNIWFVFPDGDDRIEEAKSD